MAIEARGLAVLERIARTISDDITVVAPAEEQSGKGRALTLTEPFRVSKRGENRYAVRGTPTDCVMFALAEPMKGSPPDLVLSGVNRGGNLAEDVSYSGTVSPRWRARFAGIRSDRAQPALCPERHGRQGAVRHRRGLGRAHAASAARPRLGAAHAHQRQFPASCGRCRCRAIRVVSQGLRDYGRVGLDKRTDPRGFDYYWLAMSRLPHQPMPNSDLDAIEQGFVTVTPLHLDLTHHESPRICSPLPIAGDGCRGNENDAGGACPDDGCRAFGLYSAGRGPVRFMTPRRRPPHASCPQEQPPQDAAARAGRPRPSRTAL